jgi:hypothetical protein
MAGIDRRQFLAGSMGLLGAVALGACTADDTDGEESSMTDGAPATAGTALAAPGTAGLMDEATYQRRVDEYLAFATSEVHLDNPTGIAVQLIAAHRDPTFAWPIEQATVDGLSDVWEQIDTWQDTRDFSLMYLTWVLALGQGPTPMTSLDPELLAAIERRMLDNRYRYDDPNPEGRVDSQWYWSENHVVIGLVNEYLAGQAFPEATFTVTGLSGAEHMARSKPGIVAWLDERARFGFFEWHSHVYMLKNISPLLTLAELAEDPELVRLAGMGLDLCVLDMAAHTHAGTYVAPRGRTYKKDKMTSLDEDTFGTSKLLFADTDHPYQSRTDTGASYLCGAKRYRPPLALVEMAVAPAPGVVRERHGIFVDGTAPVTDNPEAPFGYDFADPENLTFWWSQGALGLWQVADIGLAEAEEHRLFDNPSLFQVKVLTDINDGDPEKIKAWEQDNHAVVNFGHLREANTYAWRGDAVSLASVVDHRFGQMRDQVHSWVAAVDAEALVFTTHPSTAIDETTDWDVDSTPGYWTGEASMPRSAQFERTGIHIYQPGWDETTDAFLWSVFGYRDYTHAYVPQDRFDEVAQDGHWTVARKGDGYIALWSWRTPTFLVYDPAIYATAGMSEPFDLVAEGGPDNVWIVEVGERRDGPFESWVTSIMASEPLVERSDTGFTVAWRSPSAGEVAFGSTGAFTVAGQVVQIDDFPRHDSPFGTVDHLATTYALASDSASLELDFATQTRTVAAAP